MEKKKIEVYIDISDNEMVGFTGPEDIEIALVHFIDNDKVEVEITDNVIVEVVRGTGIQSLMNTQEVKK